MPIDWMRQPGLVGWVMDRLGRRPLARTSLEPGGTEHSDLSGGALARLSVAALPSPSAGVLYAASVSGSYYACLLRVAVWDSAAGVRVQLDAPDPAELDGPSRTELDDIRALARAPAWSETAVLDAAASAALRRELVAVAPERIADVPPEVGRLGGWHLSGLVVAADGARHAFSASSPRGVPAERFWRALHAAAEQGVSHWKSHAALDLFSVYDRSLGRVFRDCGGQPRHVRVLAWDDAALAEALAQLGRLRTGEPLVVDLTPGNARFPAIVEWACARPRTAVVAGSGTALAGVAEAALDRVFPSVAEARAALAPGPARDRGPEHLG